MNISQKVQNTNATVQELKKVNKLKDASVSLVWWKKTTARWEGREGPEKERGSGYGEGNRKEAGNLRW